MSNLPLNQILLGDCLEIMRGFPDKSIDLVLTDPPYGIGASKNKFVNGNRKIERNDEYGDWDESIPSQEYFDEIFRISKNQVIWGGNYFIGYLKPSRCFLIWDKTIHGNSYADCEMAWTSFNNVARIKALNMVETTKDGRVHPTQKPLKLMRWCIENYSKEGEVILDPFAGSCTTLVACKMLKRNYIGIEKEEKYVNICHQRLQATASPMF